MSKTFFVRTEPQTRASSLEAGVAARIHDPAWLLGRQWQLGELRGDDAGTPVSVALEAESALVSAYRPAGTKPFFDYNPLASPLEALVEAEPQRSDPTWTARLRIDTGRAWLSVMAEAGLGAGASAIRAAFPFEPASAELRERDPGGARLLDVAAGRIPDGQSLYTAIAPPLRAGNALPSITGVDTSTAAFSSAAAAWLDQCDAGLVEPGATAAWQPETLDYAFDLATSTGLGATQLVARDHRGGGLDWSAFDAAPPPGPPSDFKSLPTQTLVPTGVRFHGMPNARWWEFEDATIDFGNIDGGASDLARLAFLEFALVYGNDFFAVPLRLPIGSLTRITALVVADTFGLKLSIESTNRQQTKPGAARFSLFALTEPGLTPQAPDGRSDLFFLAPAAHPLSTSKPLEEVLLLRDEMANLAWAVERRYEGERGLPVERHEVAVLTAPDRPPARLEAERRYLLGSGVPPYWFPLVPIANADGVRLELQRMTDQPLTDVPMGRILSFGGPTLPDCEVPREGTRLWRENVLTRWSNGVAFGWTRLRRAVGRGEGSSGLRFDVAEELAD